MMSVEKYESDKMTASYTGSCVVLEWKEGECCGDDYRTPMLHVAELVRKHDCKILAVDMTNLEKIEKRDIDWARKNFYPALTKAGLEKLIVVGAKPGMLDKETVGKKFDVKVCRADSMEQALEMAGADKGPSEEVLAMTREQALEYMGLPKDANAFAIDEKFWQLSKRYRGTGSEEDEQKLTDLSCVYNIATGRRDSELAAREARDNARKFLGKTSGEWKTWFSYAWLPMVIGLVVILSAVFVFKQVFVTSHYDCSVVAFGHFDYDNEPVTEVLERAGYERPYVTAVDIVVPNDQNQTGSVYAGQTLSAVMYSSPDLLITDEMTYGYYYDYLGDISLIYEDLESLVNSSVYSKIEPVYMSEREAAELSNEYIEDTLSERDTEDPMNYSDSKVMVGLKITDREIISKLGFSVLWPDSEACIIFSMYYDCDSAATTTEILADILNYAA